MQCRSSLGKAQKMLRKVADIEVSQVLIEDYTNEIGGELSEHLHRQAEAHAAASCSRRASRPFPWMADPTILRKTQENRDLRLPPLQASIMHQWAIRSNFVSGKAAWGRCLPRFDSGRRSIPSTRRNRLLE